MPSPLQPGSARITHVVVLMMENRSFDHMLGGLRAFDARIDGLTGTETNPDSTGASVQVQPKARYQGQLDPTPSGQFQDVDVQIFGGDATEARTATMQGFVKNYWDLRRDAGQSRVVMNYFTPEKLPVLTTLATEFAVFNRWFSSIPGSTLGNHAFAHYGTSFGHVGMELFYANQTFKSIYERLLSAGLTAKMYPYDHASSFLEVVNVLQHPAQFFGTYQQFMADCESGTLPHYSFVAPNYSDHDSDNGVVIASDQHPDHHVAEGERFIASVYNAIRSNASLWEKTVLLIVYSQHGGLYDHVPPAACTADGFVAQPKLTGTGRPFAFDRLGVRVPAVLVSPWIPKGLVVDRVFEHASIPATLTSQFIGEYADRSPREKAAATFLDLLTLGRMRTDVPEFDLDGTSANQSDSSRYRSVPASPEAGQVRTAPRPALQVFLCHSKYDKPAVRQLYARLHAEPGIRPWFDENDLLPGQDWELEITRAVRNSHCVIVCCSKRANNNAGFVHKEIRFALDEVDRLPDNTIYLIPAKLEECEVAERLRRFHWVDLFEPSGYENLMRALQTRANSLSNT